MSEKEQLPPDNMSLPPNYAPSEAYTESPPPAYRKERSSHVYVARMVCLTIISAALLTGFFFTFSTWLNARACHCENHHDHKHLETIQAASLVNFPSVDPVLNSIDDKAITNDDIQLKVNNDRLLSNKVEITNPDQSLEAIEEEVVRMEEIESEVEKERNIIEDTLKGQLDNLKKKIKLPIDMLLGNPSLSGKDVQCEVEKKVHDMGGFAAHAIIVTCKDENEKTVNPPLFKTPGAIKPPLSFLAPIMKMIAARAKSERLNKINNNKPNIVVHPLSGSVPRPLENHGSNFNDFPEPKPFQNENNFIPMNNIFNGPPQPFMGPVPKIIESGTIHNPIRRFDAGPMNGPIINGNVVRKAFNGATPKIIDGELMNQIIRNLPMPHNVHNPVIRIEERRSFQPFPFNNRPVPFSPLQGQFHPIAMIKPVSNDIRMLPPQQIIRNNFPMPPVHHPINEHIPHNHLNEEIPPFPPMPRNNLNHNMPQIHHVNNEVPHQNINKPDIPLSHPRDDRVLELPTKPEPIAGPQNEPFPFPLPKNVIPLKPMKIEEHEQPKSLSKMIKLLPLNIRPIRLIAPRKSRLLTPDPLFSETKEDFSKLARGVPTKSIENPETELPKELPVPEASGRGLTAPIDLPTLRLLPGRLLRLPLAPSLQLLPDMIQKRIITHMEMKKLPEDEDNGEPEQPHSDLQPPGINMAMEEQDETPETFGPPKDHSLMLETQTEGREIEIEEHVEDSQFPNFPPIPNFFGTKDLNPPFLLGNLPPPPPPPKYDPEGRSGIIPEINPDSEIISTRPIEAHEPLNFEEASVGSEIQVSDDNGDSNNRRVILLN